MASMKPVGGRLDFQHDDVCRKTRVQFTNDGGRRCGASKIHTQMSDLGSCVDAGIRSSGPAEFHFRSEVILGRASKLALHSPRIALLLPSAVAGAVILERELPGF